MGHSAFPLAIGSMAAPKSAVPAERPSSSSGEVLFGPSENSFRKQPFFEEFFPQENHQRIIHVQYLDRDSADSSLADDPRSVDSEVIFPSVPARIPRSRRRFTI